MSNTLCFMYHDSRNLTKNHGFSFKNVDKNVDGAMHFIYLHKYDTNSAEDSCDMNRLLFRA